MVNPLETELASRGVKPLIAKRLCEENWTLAALQQLPLQQLIGMGLSQEAARLVASKRIGFLAGAVEFPHGFDEMGRAEILQDFEGRS